MSAEEFYDNYIAYQVESGINDRIYNLYKRTCKAGLDSSSNVLEIGCGIGALTYLLSKHIKEGAIEAIDISPASIDYAKKYLSQKNISFFASDILNFIPSKKIFDRILLFDVIEHIPAADHPLLFKKISGWMNDDSLLLINLPNPDYILYDQKNNPSVLQELDQAIYTERLAADLAAALLDINCLETYSVWVENDYKFLVIKRRKEFKEVLLSGKRNFFQKAAIKFARSWRKIKYKYPVKIKQ